MSLDEITWLDKEINRLKDIIIKAKLHHKAPCCICGYNGPNYYQPETHDCMTTLGTVLADAFEKQRKKKTRR